MATSANPAMYARYTLLLAAATAVHAYQIGAGAGRSIVQRAIDMAAPAAAADFGLGALSRNAPRGARGAIPPPLARSAPLSPSLTRARALIARRAHADGRPDGARAPGAGRPAVDQPGDAGDGPGGEGRLKGLREPLLTDMGDDEIFVSKDSIHILKHHGSYMQQNRMLKGKEKQKSYQFMLRLKVPCGEIPPAVYKELDDLSNKYGQGDLRATTRQAFQLHGVLKGNLKTVIAAIANVGSNTYGGCGDINRNIMTPPVEFANNKAYGYANQYSRAIAELFKPMTEAFNEIWHAAPPPQPRTPRHSRSPGRRATAAAPLPPPPRQTPARPCLASERIPTARPQARRREGGDRRVLAARHWRVQA